MSFWTSKYSAGINQADDSCLRSSCSAAGRDGRRCLSCHIQYSITAVQYAAAHVSCFSSTLFPRIVILRDLLHLVQYDRGQSVCARSLSPSLSACVHHSPGNLGHHVTCMSRARVVIVRSCIWLRCRRVDVHCSNVSGAPYICVGMQFTA